MSSQLPPYQLQRHQLKHVQNRGMSESENLKTMMRSSILRVCCFRTRLHFRRVHDFHARLRHVQNRGMPKSRVRVRNKKK